MALGHTCKTTLSALQYINSCLRKILGIIGRDPLCFHDRSVTCWHRSVSLHWIEEYSNKILLKTTINFPKALNSNRSIYYLTQRSVLMSTRDWSHRPIPTPSVGISGCNSVKNDGPTSIYEHNSLRISRLEPDEKFSVIGAWDSYQGHTGRPSQKHQPYVFSGNTGGWNFRWLELLVASYPPSSSHSSSSSHLKSQPCISGEYVGLVFLATEATGVFGVALVTPPPLLAS